MPLSGKQKKFLRGLAHHRPVAVTIGNAGLTDSVLNEIVSSQLAHELLKIKLPSASSEQKKQLLHDICEKSQANFVQLIGRVGIIYKPADPPKIELP